jgi:hypothetical protein
MAVVSTQTHPKLLWPGLKALWGDLFYKEWEPEYSQYLDVVDSSQAFEEYQGIAGLGLVPEKTQGQNLAFDAEKQGFNKRAVNVSYALGTQVTIEEINDNLYMKKATERTAMLRRSARQTVEVVSALQLDRAFNSSFTGADAKEMCATDHPNVSGGTFSNELTTAADMSETAIEDLTIQIMQALDDRGNRAQLMPRKLICHTNDFYRAHRILDSTLQNDTANNAINVLRSQSIIPDGILASHYMSNNDDWFIKTDCPYGMMFQWRQRPMIDEDNDFATKNFMCSVFMRFVPFWVDPRGVFGTPGAA